MKKRILAMVMAVVMAVSLLPVSAFAAGGTSEEDNPLQPADVYYHFDESKATATDYEIKLSKTAEDKGDGEFEVTLSAEAKEAVTPRHTNVIFVLDASASMNACTQTNCKHDNQTGTNCTVTHNKQNHSESRWTIATTAINSMT
ncbi:MAG: hypothetical protein J6K94_01390, partial [Ruminiclostridium sp.]|nr:hypothetical protein [Ruminiclostridium sp.]